MAANSLQTLDGYRVLLGRAGFAGVDAKDLSAEWRSLVREGIACYYTLGWPRPATCERRRHRVGAALRLLRSLLENGKLGGGRFTARR